MNYIILDIDGVLATEATSKLPAHDLYENEENTSRKLKYKLFLLSNIPLL